VAAITSFASALALFLEWYFPSTWTPHSLSSSQLALGIASALAYFAFRMRTIERSTLRATTPIFRLLRLATGLGATLSIAVNYGWLSLILVRLNPPKWVDGSVGAF
jgi:hypothetical protein